MAKGNRLELPQAPAYQENRNLSPNIDFGSDYFTRLLSGDFTGNLSWLSPLTNTNTSANALSYAQGILQPQFRDNLQQIRNEAAANGQLESSTFSDALARSQSDLNSQYQSIVSQGAINDAYQNNSNRLSLLNQGSSGLQGFTGLAQNQTNSRNQFNLENYNNQVAAAIAGQNQGGSIFGGLGTAAGLGIGALLAAPTGGLSLLAGAGLGGAIGGGVGGTIDAFRGGSSSGGYNGAASSLGLLNLGSNDYFSGGGRSAPFAGANAFNSLDFNDNRLRGSVPNRYSYLGY